jgi:hypothetical protein
VDRTGGAKEPAKEERSRDENWIDAGHAFIERRIFAPVLRFDRFFSDERDVDAERSRSFLRWRSEVRVTEDRTRPEFTTGIRATLRLPGLNQKLRRLRIVIAGETRDAVDTLFPRRAGRAPSETTTTDDDDLGNGDAGLRFQLWDSLLTHADLGGGILVQLPPGVYTRVRVRYAVPVRDLFLTRTAVSLFWRSDDDGFGVTTAVDLERLLSPSVVARVSGSGTVHEVTPGLEWGFEAGLLASVGDRAVAQLAAAINGTTDPVRVFDPVENWTRRSHWIGRYRIFTRFRRDIYRRWLFVELEPELAWPWNVELGRHQAWGLTFRFEVQFQGTEPPPPAPAP